MTRLVLVGKWPFIKQRLQELQGIDPASGLSYDLIRDINSGEYMGPLPITSNKGFDGRKS